MNKIFLFVITILMFAALAVNAQVNKPNPDLLKVWTIEEFIENGKKYADEDMVEVVVDFKEDGTYIYWEENEADNGKWEISEDNTKIVFDKGTADELIWDIVSFDPSKLIVKFSVDKSKYKFTFSPKVKKTEE